MPRSVLLSAGLLVLSVLSFGAAAQSSAPTPSPDATSEDDATALAKKLQNPIGDLYNFPFQNNTNFAAGPHKGTQDILNVQPVIPIHINNDWNVITRTILPLVWQPSFQPAQTVPFGTGPTTFSAFLSPSKPVDGWLWVEPGLQRLGRRSDRRVGLYEGAVGRWRTGQQRLVVRGHFGTRRYALQHVPDAAVRELQFW
jgi:hypothetical protein